MGRHIKPVHILYNTIEITMFKKTTKYLRKRNINKFL